MRAALEPYHAFERDADDNQKASGWAKFIAYGHTHHSEIVPLAVASAGRYYNQRNLVNSGTWRLVHELASFHPGQKLCFGYHVMNYLTFFKGDKRKGRVFESSMGALDTAPLHSDEISCRGHLAMSSVLTRSRRLGMRLRDDFLTPLRYY